MGAGSKEVATIEALPDKVTALNGQIKNVINKKTF